MRANEPTNKIFYKGRSDDFIVFVEDAATLKNWKNDSSIPLSDVINGWKIFVTHKYVSSTPPLHAAHCRDKKETEREQNNTNRNADTAPKESSTALARPALRTNSALTMTRSA